MMWWGCGGESFIYNYDSTCCNFEDFVKARVDDVTPQ